MLKVSSKSSILLFSLSKDSKTFRGPPKKQTPLSIFIHIYYFLCLINDNLVTKLSYFFHRERERKLTASWRGLLLRKTFGGVGKRKENLISSVEVRAKLKGLSSFLSFFALTVFFMLYVQVLCLCYYYLLFFDHHITFNDWFSSWVFIFLVSLLCFFLSLLMVYGFSSF